jgi:cytidine deaminase
MTKLSAKDRELLEKALAAARTAYAPYSHFSVGAAVRTTTDKIYSGSNLENAAYGVGICAEVSALTEANSAGDFDVETIAVIGHPSNKPASGRQIVTPCGRCRQIIFEAGQVSGKDVRVICSSGDLTKYKVYKISKLLPEGFGPAALGVDVKSYRKKKG